MKQFIYTLAICLPFVLPAQPFGTNFDSWAIHAEGSWSESESEGAYRGNGIYCNFGNEYSGLRKIGFNTVGDQLRLPPATNPGTLSFFARTSSGASARLRVQYTDGPNLVTAGEFSVNSTSYQRFSAFIGVAGENTNIWIEMSSYGNSVFLDDLSLSAFEVLPVELTAFEARPSSGGQVVLTWQTLTETDNQEFTVERSPNGQHFTAIGHLAGAGTSAALRRYSFTDPAPRPGLNYYRLRQTDFDGTTALSKVISVTTTAANRPYLLSRSDPQDLDIWFEQPVTHSGEVRLFDLSGRLLLQSRLGAGLREHHVPLPALTAGIYVVQIRMGGERWVEKMVKR